MENFLQSKRVCFSVASDKKEMKTSLKVKDLNKWRHAMFIGWKTLWGKKTLPSGSFSWSNNQIDMRQIGNRN